MTQDTIEFQMRFLQKYSRLFEDLGKEKRDR